MILVIIQAHIIYYEDEQRLESLFCNPVIQGSIGAPTHGVKYTLQGPQKRGHGFPFKVKIYELHCSTTQGMCACVCVHVYTHTHVHTYTYINIIYMTYIYIHIYTYMYMSITRG